MKEEEEAKPKKRLRLTSGPPKPKPKFNIKIFGKERLFAFKSLNLFSIDYKYRYYMIWLIEWKWFDRFIIFLIMLNSIFLGTMDYKDPTSDHWGNQLVRKSEGFFLIIFTLECLIKIIAMGFVLSEGCYL